MVTVLHTGPSRAFHVDLMDEIPAPLFHTLSQVDRSKVTLAEREWDGEEVVEARLYLQLSTIHAPLPHLIHGSPSTCSSWDGGVESYRLSNKSEEAFSGIRGHRNNPECPESTEVYPVKKIYRQSYEVTGRWSTCEAWMGMKHLRLNRQHKRWATALENIRFFDEGTTIWLPRSIFVTYIQSPIL